MSDIRKNEYVQERPQSQTADKPMTPLGSHTTITRHQELHEDELIKATSSLLFPIRIMAELEWT